MGDKMIVAKAVVPDKYWILRQDDRKIGNIEADNTGFRVRINGQLKTFNTISTIKKQVQIEFEDRPKIKKTISSSDSVYGFCTTSRPYNTVYDVKHQVPLWTRESRSKSWYAAGWYLVQQGRSWQVEQCPKLIMLERYNYRGPFHSQQEAEAAK
jgi:hypothetical protein